jgi:hypothetical protein
VEALEEYLVQMPVILPDEGPEGQFSLRQETSRLARDLVGV